MFDYNDPVPEESQVENQSLIQHLEHLHDTHVQDTISFERMRQRLALAHTEDQSTSSPGTFSSEMQAVAPAYQSGSKLQQLYARKPGKRVLTALVAVFILALVLASLAFALLRFQQPSPTSPQAHYKNGWVLVQSFSGTGSKKLTNLHIGPLQTIGMTVDCSDPKQQSAKFALNYQITGNLDHDKASGMEGGCSGNLSAPPQIYGKGASDLYGSPLIAKDLTVTVPPTLTWQVFVFKNTNPPLMLDNSQWSPTEVQFSGYSSLQPSLSFFANLINTRWPRIVGIKYLCYGSGSIGIVISHSTLDTDQPKFTSACDGKIHEKQVSGASLHGVDKIGAQTSAGSEWYILIEGHK